MKNFIHPGIVCAFLAPYAVASGAGFQVGSEFAVAMSAADQGAPVEGMTSGVCELPKSNAAGTDFTQGTKLYWDNAAKLITKVANGNLFVGYARRDAAAADAICRIRLHGAPA